MQTNANVPILITLSPTGAVVDQRNMTEPDPGCSFGPTQFVPETDLVVAAEGCTGATPARSDTLVVQAFDGQARAPIATLPPSIGVNGLAYDQTGHFLLLSTIDPAGDAASAALVQLHDGQQQPVPHSLPPARIGGVTPVW